METKWRSYRESKFTDNLYLWFWELEEYADGIEYELRTEFYRENIWWTPTQKESMEINKIMERENELVKFFNLIPNNQ